MRLTTSPKDFDSGLCHLQSLGRHLSEFWMIEPEIAFADLYDDMQCAEDYVR